MLFTCAICNFSAPTNSRYQKHLATQKHARNLNKCLLVPVNEEPNVQEIVDSVTEEPNVQEIVDSVTEEHNVQEIVDSVTEEPSVEISYEEIQNDPFFEYHIVSDSDFQPINPIFLDIDTFNFFQSIKKTIDTNPYVIYIIGFFFSLYSALHEFINPASDSSVEYIDCTPSQDSFPNTSVQD
jgi:hypothetical protein